MSILLIKFHTKFTFHFCFGRLFLRLFFPCHRCSVCIYGNSVFTRRIIRACQKSAKTTRFVNHFTSAFFALIWGFLRGKFLFRNTFHSGTKGTLETDKTKPMDDAHTFARFMDVPGTFEEKIDIPVTTRFPNEHLPGYHGGADLKMMRAFIKCIIDDTEPPINVDTGIRMTIPGLIAAESAKNGGQLMEIPQI